MRHWMLMELNRVGWICRGGRQWSAWDTGQREGCQPHPQGCLVCFPCKTLPSELLWADREEHAPSPQGAGSKLYKKDNLCVDSASYYVWRGYACQSLTLCGALGRVSTVDQEKDKAALEEQEVGKVPSRVYRRK